MSKEAYDKAIKDAADKAAAAARRAAKKTTSKENPNPDDATPSAGLSAEDISRILDEKLSSFQSSLSEKDTRGGYDLELKGYGVPTELANMLYENWKANKPTNLEEWLIERYTAIGAKLPRELRTVAALKNVGPTGVSDPSQVESVFDLSDDERKRLGPGGIRQIYEKTSGRGAGGNIFIREKK
jgi:hypothetical protein